MLGATALAAVPSFAGESAALDPQTQKNLEAGLHGEAFASLKYQAYAEKARETGQPALARLFDESANVEANEHFAREADALGPVRTDAANLKDAMAGEHYEYTKMYIEFADQAVGDTKASSSGRSRPTKATTMLPVPRASRTSKPSGERL